ncbi:MAG: SDR family NAD(P)-dependent oxidoreductase, partial [Persicimonas sp.]
MKTLQGRNAIVTGASRGLGVHIARTLARKQVNLALAARSVDELDKVQREMASLGVEAVAIPTRRACVFRAYPQGQGATQ